MASGAAWVSGGTGGSGSLAAGGDGGDGYGGGAEGNTYQGGGAGGSWVASGTASFSASGGAGGAGGNPTAAGGSPGQVTLTFLGSVATTVTSSPAPSHTLTWSGSSATGVATSAIMNTWVATPTTATPPSAGRRLLGWSTSADFPVDRAEAATSAFDGLVDGRRMIYLPAGHFTFVSGDNTLYPIWSNAARLTRC